MRIEPSFDPNFLMMLELSQSSDKLKRLENNIIGLSRQGHSGKSSFLEFIHINMFMYFPAFPIHGYFT